MEIKKIVGQVEARRRLERIVTENRLPHALLFFGREGSGKRRVAENLAVTLLCSGRGAETMEPCGHCADCRAMASGTHPDFYLIEPTWSMKNGKPNTKGKKAIRIEDIQRLRTELARLPKLAKRRVVIIDDADKMNEMAENALLKTLEEPTGEVVFILVTSNRTALLDTIISRCLTLPFVPLAESEVVEILEERGVDADRAVLLAALSEGSAGEALRLNDDDALERRDDAIATLDKLGGLGTEEILSEAKRLSEMSTLEAGEWLKYMRFALMDIVTLYIGGDHLYNRDVGGKIARLMKKISEPWARRALKVTGETEHRVNTSNATLELQFDAMLLKLAAI